MIVLTSATVLEASALTTNFSPFNVFTVSCILILSCFSFLFVLLLVYSYRLLLLFVCLFILLLNVYIEYMNIARI
jgi:hypothetical protein